MKALLLTAATALALAGPVSAEEKNAIDPAKKGPTDAVTETVPKMTAPEAGTSAPAGSGQAAGESGESRPATKSVGDAVPPMSPNDAAKTGASTTTTPGDATTTKTETDVEKSTKKSVQ